MLTGVYPQLDYPTAAASAQSIAATPMVSVLKLSRAQIAEAISKHNAQQKTDKAMVHLSLTNGAKMFVVSGATESIKGFVRALYKEHDTGGADQTRVRHSQRKSGVSTKYLSINAPYHCPLLGHAVEGACRYASSKGWELDSRDMRRAVRAGDDGHDIRGVGNLSQYLLQSMCVLPVDWCKATGMDGVTHIVDFGPGGLSGFGVLTQRIVDGRGVPVICVGALSRQRSSGLGTKADMYKSKARELTAAANWEKQFRPGVVRTESDGKLHISTRMSRLLGKPPLMVAGMTPSTVSEVFVSAVMRAGYHVELSGGGHFSEEMLRDKVDRILELTEAGQGVSINSIYVNPFLWSIQYPAVQAMRREGIPMEGLCIGAGVPSFDVCSEIIASIREAGFRHIGLKPSSVETIRLVIKIAQANADFPILLQWTGGRGGGHHSFEDFHQPILDTYGAIRAQSNIVLVAGSGFGGVDDTLPYLTGDWSRRFDCAPMPFDGCLLGSRVMVAKEGAASDAVKAAIVAAPGVDDSEWEKTYSGPAGGIVTVLSEMGEPIHKIATRGVLFWKELDDTVFSLPRDKRLAALLGKKGYIIQRLNDDFQKPWFGKKADGSVADVEEMTYGEVAKRLVEVLYIKHQSRWIDVTMRNLVGDYLQRVEERFAGGERAAVLQSFEQINSPLGTVQAVLDAYPESQTQLLTSEDVQFFINLCMRPGQKPVPFIPVMDKDFHIWFKKDSLWQSEDLDAVAGQDVGRVCILQGPVAVRYATKANEPVKDILDGIYHGQIAALLDQYYGGDERRVPVVGYVGEAPAACAVPAHVRVEASETERVFTLAATEAQLPKADAWLEAVAGSELGWLRALLTARVVAQGRRYADNVVRRVLRPRAGLVARVRVEGGRAQAVEVADASGRRALGIALEAGSTIRVSLYAAVRGAESALELLFRYRPQTPSVPIHEVVAGRDERTRRFYAHVWPGPSSGARLSNGAQQLLPADCAMRVFRDAGRVARAQDVDAFVSAVGVGGGGSGSAQGAPLDYAMCAFWPALAQCLLACGGDLRGLVHVSNTLRAVGAMRAGQRLSSEAWITEAVDGAGGRAVAVAGRVLSDGAPAVEIETAFLLRGSGGGSGSGPGSQPRGFRHVREAPAILRVADARMLALLRAKEWLVPAPAAAHLLRVGARLVFRLESRHRLGPRAHVATFGAVLAAARGGAWAHVACVDYESGTARGNAVLDFLARHAAPEHARTPVPPRAAGAASLRVPPSGAAFAAAGGDHNPIHTSAFFADAAGLPGPIAHGLWTAAAARRRPHG
ncbi:fatty acid synthase alpha subunit Lsd1 [Coemansia sp. RSA 2322]|nr:fatty acid synthase alpha subunit Lsd1 [Coemansia sp. RSA 2322]